MAWKNYAIWKASVLAIFSVAWAVIAAQAVQADDGKLFPAEAAIPNSRVIRFTSGIDKEPYTIQISIPLFPAPKSGYPVIYVLDGELYFPQAAIASDLMGSKGAVVVGIGHNTLNDKAVVGSYAPRKKGKAFSIDGDSALAAFNVMRDGDFWWPAKRAPRGPALSNLGR